MLSHRARFTSTLARVVSSDWSRWFLAVPAALAIAASVEAIVFGTILWLALA
jgi:hypothetical protein